MTVIDLAKEIATKANPDYRSDGFEEIIYKLALQHLQTAYQWGAESIMHSNSYTHKEDMGR